jgi:hypothetical protein
VDNRRASATQWRDSSLRTPFFGYFFDFREDTDNVMRKSMPDFDLKLDSGENEEVEHETPPE